MVVIEDVDCCVSKRDGITVETRDSQANGPAEACGDKEAEAVAPVAALFGVTLSGLLNALDGLQAPSGVMFFMTTNRIEKLDPALLRPGRTDVREYFGPATEQQKLQLYRRFFPENNEECGRPFCRTLQPFSYGKLHGRIPRGVDARAKSAG